MTETQQEQAGTRPSPSIVLTLPPRVFNTSQKEMRQSAGGAALAVVSEWADHIADGPYTTTMLTLLAAHSGDSDMWIAWGYNQYADLMIEDRFWANDATEKFVSDHSSIKKKAAEVYTAKQPWTWTSLHEDLSYRPTVAAAEYGSYRFFKIDQVTVRPGQFDAFAEYRRLYTRGAREAACVRPNWAYEVDAGSGTDSFQIWTPFSSITELDELHADRARIGEALGSEDRARLAELAAASIVEAKSNMYSTYAAGSFVQDDVFYADVDFWTSTRPTWP